MSIQSKLYNYTSNFRETIFSLDAPCLLFLSFKMKHLQKFQLIYPLNYLNYLFFYHVLNSRGILNLIAFTI
jgi:hypothetical protein